MRDQSAVVDKGRKQVMSAQQSVTALTAVTVRTKASIEREMRATEPILLTLMTTLAAIDK